ncbi:unnamed protein product [Caenorhabditis angaria]|uniref:Protein kinase domain-containing protein n=1 Tax=Caenorhabditis angaria TaxID=860376 RepID=A0A9P1N1U1_9PELO|nr:unnamed protein product [Caenorhabditis angaria]
MGEDVNKYNNNQCGEKLVFNVGDIVTGYKIEAKIDEGGFGQVFRVLEEGKVYAMKIESNKLEGGSAIKLEIDVLKDLQMRKVPNFPQVVRAGRKRRFHFIVMELLGDNLHHIKYRSPNQDSFSVGTWTRIGIQCLYVVKLLHDNGFLHRDLKPQNFGLGPVDDYLKKRLIYLFDFGLARRFVNRNSPSRANSPIKSSGLSSENQKDVGKIKVSDYRWRIARPRSDFRGTQMYASPNAHDFKELGRADDVWSLMFMLAGFIKELPWATVPDNDLANVKKSAKLSEMLKDESFAKVEENLRSCDYYTFPDYDLAYNTLKSIMDKNGIGWNDPYDWEMKDSPGFVLWKLEKLRKNVVYIWEDPKDFFKVNVWENLERPIKVAKKGGSGEAVSCGAKKEKEKDDVTKDYTFDEKSIRAKLRAAERKKKSKKKSSAKSKYSIF